MNAFSKIIVIILVVLAVMYVKDTFFTENENPFENTTETVTQPTNQEKKENNENKIEENTISIYYTNANSGELKKIQKIVPDGQNELNFAINTLIKGPNSIEKNKGYSSEIPTTTKILGIKDQGSLIVIDLSDDFQYGGGTESQYARLKQLIKTITELKLSKPVYLYLNGEKAETIGGEGIIISQPLSESSLNE